MNESLKNVYNAVVEGAMQETSQKVQAALDEGAEPEEILNDGLIGAMNEVGRQFETGQVYVPEMLIAAKSMKYGLELLRPHLVEADVQPLGRVVIATVQGDLHDIGKNLVSMMLEGAGFEVIDLGVDVKPEEMIAAVKEHQPDLVALSALLTTTMENMRTVMTMLEEAGVRNELQVMVGGAPVTQNFADEIGAEGFSVDASQAAKLAKKMVS
jgi:5-methyltetrahydrofolate--homocysteine methyltransferase